MAPAPELRREACTRGLRGALLSALCHAQELRDVDLAHEITVLLVDVDRHLRALDDHDPSPVVRGAHD